MRLRENATDAERRERRTDGPDQYASRCGAIDYEPSDEAVLDIYTQVQDGGWRILANNFDFSCLGDAKTLLAGQNFALLRKSICERATLAEYNDSYSAIRRNLELVWPSEQQTSSTGWRRERAGKYSTGEVAMTSNESQFTRYSRLCHLLKVGASTPA